MHIYTLLHFALLTSVTAKPLARPRSLKRQYTNATSLNTITETSTDTTPSSTCAATPECTATHLPRPDENCGTVASNHGIQLYNQEAAYSSDSTNCDSILRGYGICCAPNSIPIDPSIPISTLGPTISPASNETVINGTVPFNATVLSLSVAPSGINTGKTTETTLTTLRTSTYTYALGSGSNTRITTVIVTHTDFEVITFTTTITLSGPRPTSPAPAASVSLTTSLVPPATITAAIGALPSESTSATSTSSLISARSPTISTTLTPLTSTMGVISTSAAVVSSAPVSSCTGTLPAPAPTQAGIATGCTAWYVAKPGDYCIKVANQFGVGVVDFMAWNPAVGPTCSTMWAGDAYCVSRCGSVVASSSAAPTSASLATYSGISQSSQGAAITTSALSTSASIPASAPSATSGVATYVSYVGDGSVAAGWPAMSRWTSFDDMFTINMPSMEVSCANWGVPDNTDEEIEEMRSAIQSVAASSGIDARFILAIIMQESTGCVRVITTAYSVFNPGLMQSHNGTGTCNTNSAPIGIPGTSASLANVKTPCPASEIIQMIKDGTQGTSSGDGLQQLFAAQKSQSSDEAMAYYRTARAYNGGSVDPSGNLNAGCCTASYVEDIANRLRGWVKPF